MTGGALIIHLGPKVIGPATPRAVVQEAGRQKVVLPGSQREAGSEQASMQNTQYRASDHVLVNFLLLLHCIV